MRIYLDNCCLQRPLDDQTHPRIRVETEAVFAVLAAVVSGDQQLLSSGKPLGSGLAKQHQLTIKQAARPINDCASSS
jgi:hypothetical protein